MHHPQAVERLLTELRQRTNLERPRLLEKLRAVESHGLAVIVAPVGFGKTTLLGQWSLHRGSNVLWCDPANLPTPEQILREGTGRGGLRGVVIDGVPQTSDSRTTQDL